MTGAHRLRSAGSMDGGAGWRCSGGAFCLEGTDLFAVSPVMLFGLSGL